MNDAAWERLVDAIDVNLGIADHGRTKQPLEDRPDLTQQIEHIEFNRDGQNFRLERSTGPSIIDRKTHYSHRPGVANRSEYIYDEHEIGHKVTLLRKVGSDWEPVDMDQLGL
ncbi:MAG TPA: hypothetical protein VMR75_03785 [Candidatus Saccharimonadales bacterium]|nr:hypothetical protein [Candidatus Saccharimonadales bacterium]